MFVIPASLTVAQLLIGQGAQCVISGYQRRYSGKKISWVNGLKLIAFAKDVVKIRPVA
ncbi:Uncharacterised protein [Burkholderia pseudomallei]|nr:Uncharacterised protein [Burkholderia pseudomallei]